MSDTLKMIPASQAAEGETVKDSLRKAKQELMEAYSKAQSEQQGPRVIRRLDKIIGELEYLQNFLAK